MKIHATQTAILCILLLVIFWVDVNAQRDRSDEAVSRNRRQDTIGFGLQETLEKLNKSVETIKQDLKRLEKATTKNKSIVEQLEDKQRILKEKIDSVLEFQKEFRKEVADFRTELAGVKRELIENRNAWDQKFVIPLETLNQTVHHLKHETYKDLTQQVAELRAERQREAAAASESFELTKKLNEALQQISELRENYVSKADPREKRAISNKCSLNVRHKPEDGRVDMLMVMDPPNTDPAECS